MIWVAIQSYYRRDLSINRSIHQTFAPNRWWVSWDFTHYQSTFSPHPTKLRACLYSNSNSSKLPLTSSDIKLISPFKSQLRDLIHARRHHKSRRRREKKLWEKKAQFIIDNEDEKTSKEREREGERAKAKAKFSVLSRNIKGGKMLPEEDLNSI